MQTSSSPGTQTQKNIRMLWNDYDRPGTTIPKSNCFETRQNIVMSIESRRSTVCEVRHKGPEKKGIHPPKPSQTLVNAPGQQDDCIQFGSGIRSAAEVTPGTRSDLRKSKIGGTLGESSSDFDDCGPVVPRLLVAMQQPKTTPTYSRSVLTMISKESDFTFRCDRSAP